MTINADDVWRLLAELAEAQKETERQFQETERRFQETDRRFQESDRRFEETKQLLQRQSEESERHLRETERIIKQQNQQLNQELGKLGNRLGEFVEWQVRPAVVQLFQQRGIAVNEFHPNISVKRFGEALEIDLLVVNSDQAILVEVKSKLTQTDINEHLERLEKFKRLMPRYSDVKAMGAVAGMVVPEEVASYGYRRGLFVLAQSGDSVVILNDDKFRPRQW
ncbi:MAG: arginine--tRNA ligase [Limnospira maxima]